MTTSAFARALRAKYGSDRKAVLRKLGIDEAVLSAPPPPSSSNGGDRLTAMRVEIEQLLSELDLDEKQVSRILEMLNKHAPFDRVDDDDPNAERARELAGDDESAEERERRLREFLTKKGFGAADIQKALDYANGEPWSAFSGLRGQMLAGDDLACLRRITHEPGGNRMSERDRRQAMDAATAAVNGYADLVREFPDIARIRTA
jgi:hypothetical protein